MRVLVIATNRERFPHAVAPVGAAQIVAALKQAGHEAELLDLCFARHLDNAILAAVARFRPDVVGLSIRNLDNCSCASPHTFLNGTQEVIHAVRSATDVELVAGGGAVSVAGPALIQRLGLRFGIVGEGERSLLQLLDALQRGGDTDAIAGLVRVEPDRVHWCPTAFDLELDQLPGLPSTLLDYRRYFRAGGFVSLQTKRGCPFSCAYCNYGQIEGTRYRLRSPGLCVDDIERFVVDRGLTDFFFSDSVFNLPRQHAVEICEEIVRRGLNIRWMAYCNPRRLDRDVARLFKVSGCAGVELGLDAAVEKMIEVLQKNFSQSDIAQAFGALTAQGVPFSAFLLFGGRHETWTDIRESQRFLRDSGRCNAVIASIGIRVYRNTTVHRWALEEGRISRNTCLLDPTFYVSSALGEDPLARLDEVAAEDPVWTTPTDWRGWPIRLLSSITNRTRSLPAWKETAFYGKHLRRFVRRRARP